MLIALFSVNAEVVDSVIEIINGSITLSRGHTSREVSKLDRLIRGERTLHFMQPTTDLLRILMGRLLLSQPLLTDT
jgi:hypothetical protein